MALTQAEIDAIEVLTNTYALDYELAKQLAQASGGDVASAYNGSILLRRGWLLAEVLDSLRNSSFRR